MAARGLDDPLLQRRHRLRRQFDAEVAARHHHAVARLDDLFEPLDRRRLLDLGEQGRLAADQLARFPQIVGSLHEAERDPVDALIDCEGQVATVLRGQCRHRHHHIGNVEALVVAQGATDLDIGDDALVVMLDHAQHQFAVVEQQARAGFHRFEDFLVRQLDAARVARRLVAVEYEHRIGLEFDASLGELADAQFRSLQVGQDRGRPAVFLFQAADRLDHADLRCLVAMAHVDAKRVGAGFEQLGDHFGRVARRAQCREDTDFARARSDGLGHPGEVPLLVERMP